MSDFSREAPFFHQNSKANFFSKKVHQPFKANTTHKRAPTISFPQTPCSMNPSDEFSRTHYSKNNFQRVLLRNVLTPQTPQITNRRGSNNVDEKNSKPTTKSRELTRPPTEAFNKWKNDDKCKLLLVEDGILDKEEDSKKQFKRFDDAMLTHTSWVKSFDQEKTVKDILFKQLQYNEKNKQVLRTTMQTCEQGTINELVEKIGIFQKKITRMPPVKKTKKKPQNYLTLNDEYATVESFEEETMTSFTFYWNIMNQNSWKPPVREGATLMDYEGKIYLYGGLSNELHSDLCELNVESNIFHKKF